MEFASPLTQAILLKRYKRFLAEIVVNNQEHRFIYCPNMGAMTGCDTLGSRIWFSRSNNPRRKFPDTWELVEVDSGYLVCVNTQNSTQLILEGIKNGIVKEVQGYTHLRMDASLKEHTYDLLLQKDIAYTEGLAAKPPEKCYLQVKCVTLGDEIHRGFYPDCPMEKSLQQLKALIFAHEQGHRAILAYCVQHTGINRLFPADHIDSKYGSLLRQAIIAGVEVLAYRVDISLSDISLAHPVEVRVPTRLICSYRS